MNDQLSFTYTPGREADPMRSIKALELLNAGKIDELRLALQDDIYQETLKKKPNAKKRYAAMKKYFSYRDSPREVCQKPCEVEYNGKKYTSFTNSYSLALTTEPIGEIELFDEANGKYPDVGRLVTVDGEEGKINFENVIAEAKSKGYRLKHAELFSNGFLMHYKGAYFRIALVDSTYNIIADGQEATVYFTGIHKPLVVVNDIGICVILPIRYDGVDPSESGSHVINAEPMEEEKIIELINRRRRQILVHSIIYYKMDDNLIEDNTWAQWAKELYELQHKYPAVAARCVYAREFEEFEPSTGYNLPLDDQWGNRKARQLLEQRDRIKKEDVNA